MTLPIITLAEAKGFHGIRTGDTTLDTVFEVLALAATLDIEKAIGRRLERGSRQDIFHTRRTSYFAVNPHYGDEAFERHSTVQQFYLTGLFPDQEAELEVHYDPLGVFGDDTLVDPENYRMDWENGVLHLRHGTNERENALRISYTSGLAATDGTLSAAAPADLKLGCMFQTTYLFKRRQTDNVGLTLNRGIVAEKMNRASSQAAVWNARQGLCQEAQSQVRHYRIPVFGAG